MEYMAGLKDKAFDLAIVDPPYGIGVASWMGKDSGNKRGNSASKKGFYDPKDWDISAPGAQYWKELERVSKNQIIWGGNYFPLGVTSCYIVWDKDNGNNGFADCELAWTSFNSAVRKVKIRWHGMLQYDMMKKEERVHPTQKPIKLYKWLLKNYSKPNDKILDTHLGSGSIAIACHQMNFDLVGCEIDADYYKAAVKRYSEAIKQQTLFQYSP